MLSFKYLSMAFRKSGKPGQDVCLILWGRIFWNEPYCCFYVMVDCILCQNAFNRLIVYEFGFVLQLGKIVASIEQKPVSLNDMWRVELLSRLKAIFEWAHVIDCNCQSVEDDSCKEAFWFLLMIFCYLCQCFCIV